METIRAAEYLSGEHVGLLLGGFLLLREDDTEIVLSARAVADAEATGQLIDPEGGLAVEDWRTNVVPIYEGTTLLNQLLRDVHK